MPLSASWRPGKKRMTHIHIELSEESFNKGNIYEVWAKPERDPSAPGEHWGCHFSTDILVGEGEPLEGPVSDHHLRGHGQPVGTLQGNESLASLSCPPCSLLRPPWLTASSQRAVAVGEGQTGIFQGSEGVQSLEGLGGK